MLFPLRIPAWHRRTGILLILVFAVACQAREEIKGQRRAGAVLHPPDSPDEAQEYYLAKRAPVGAKTLPVERYLEAREWMRRMPQHSIARDVFLPSRAEMEEKGLSYVFDAASLGAWAPLGPGNVGGRTRTLVIDPGNPGVMFAGGVAGGVWKTTDGGGSWLPLADLMANLAVTSLAMDPSRSKVLYAGTGEIFTGDGVRGAGIFKTIDGGAHWKRLTRTQTPDFQYVAKLVVSPKNGSRVYAATRTGVWRSANGGTTWQKVLTPQSADGCTDLVVRTDRSDDFLFAACGFRQDGEVYRNEKADGPGPWEQVLAEPGMSRTSLALAPSNQDVIYALSASSLPGPATEPGEQYTRALHAVFRSDQGGAPGTWNAQVRNSDATKLNRLLLSSPSSATLRECGLNSTNNFRGQGTYDNVIAVDPKDPERVWVGGIDLFRSDDGGHNWGLASYWWAQYRDAAPSFAHADQHGIVFHPRYDGGSNRTLFVTNDGGIFRTDDALAATAKGALAPCDQRSSSLSWTSLNHHYGVTQFYHGAPYPDGSRYLGGTQDNGTIRGVDRIGTDAWQQLLGGDGGYVAVHPTDSRILYAEYQGLALQKSVDGGLTWRFLSNDIDGFTLFIAPFVMDPNDPERLWLGGSSLWSTANGGDLWTETSPLPIDSMGLVSSVAVARGNSDGVMAGTSSGFILRTDSGTSAGPSTPWSSALPRPGWVSSLAFDPDHPNVAYATYSTFGGTHVWKSTDGGATWRGIDGTGRSKLPDIPVHSIVVDPNRPSRLYLGTDLGVFVSTDGGAHWAVENTGFANVVTEWLALQSGAGETRLFAFTHGRGAWRVKVRN